MPTATMDLAVKRLIRFEGAGSVKAYCDLAIGEQFLIKGVRVVEGKNGMFVSMPRQRGKDSKWYDNVIALTREAKDEMHRVVLEAYQDNPSRVGPTEATSVD